MEYGEATRGKLNFQSVSDRCDSRGKEPRAGCGEDWEWYEEETQREVSREINICFRR